MTTQKYEENKTSESIGSITVSIGKKGDVGGEFTVKQLKGETDNVFESRFDYFKNKLINECRR